MSHDHWTHYRPEPGGGDARTWPLPPEASIDQLEVVAALLDDEPRSVWHIARGASYTADAVAAWLRMLQGEGRARLLPGGWVR